MASICYLQNLIPYIKNILIILTSYSESKVCRVERKAIVSSNFEALLVLKDGFK